MCGIAGAVWTDPEATLSEEILHAMIDVLRHRGPDDQGCYRSEFRTRQGYGPQPGVALGHRRLAVIDPPGGRQPMSNEDGTVWVVFNGEIYNEPELRHRLEGSGHTFRTECDTEVLVHLYEDEGPALARHLAGMFAAAIWDDTRKQLVLVRDRLGQKPLVYRVEANRLLFASEIKSLLAVPGVPREIAAAAIDEFLFYQYVPPPGTIFQGIHKLPPAHYAVFRDGELEIKPYWEPDFNHEEPRPQAEYAEELQALLEDAVRRRLRSDVPLGAFLSGGIDSSIIVGLMQRHAAAPVKTFSIGFPQADFDETAFAREVAGQHGTDHHELRVEPNALDLLPKLVWHYDEPFADSSAIPTYYLSQLTREHVTVALSGDGGDELFAGYERYRAVQLGSWFDRLPRSMRNVIAGRYWQRLPASSRQKAFGRRLKRLMEALGHSPLVRYGEWIAIFREEARAALYDDAFIARLPDRDPLAFLAQAWQRGRKRDAVTTASLADLATYLPCDLMTKVDIASMAHGLECRSPFLDHRLVELAIRMPVQYKLSRGRGKHILRETFADLLPASVKKRGKMGFGVPLADWFRGDHRDFLRETLLAPRALDRGYFRREAVEQLLEEHASARFDHAARLWALLVLELWHREWVDG